jgi:rhodanese-related sulfurtransferase
MKKLLPGTRLSGLSILLAAAVLGLAYNKLSPLGVRFAMGSAADSPRKAEGSTSSGGSYVNETVSLSVERPFAAGGREGGGGTPAPSAALPSLTAPQVKGLLASKSIVLVDARESSAYGAEHIPGSVSLPADSAAEPMTQFKARYRPDMPVVVYCNSASCAMAARLGERLIREYGYMNVRLMPGGFVEWRLAETREAEEAARAPARKGEAGHAQ